MEEKLGVKYTEGRKTEFAKSFRESGPASPVFFILSPGVDPLKDVESLGNVTVIHTLVIAIQFGDSGALNPCVITLMKMHGKSDVTCFFPEI